MTTVSIQLISLASREVVIPLQVLTLLVTFPFN